MAEANYIATAAVFIVADLKRSTDWYAQQLGFSSAELNWDERPTFTLVECDGAAIMLQQGKEKAVANRHRTPGKVVGDAYIWVKNLQKLELMLNVAGTPIFAGPTRRTYGCTEIMVADPDDYLICFGHCPGSNS